MAKAGLIWCTLAVAAAAAARAPATLPLRLDAAGRLYEGDSLRISRRTLARDLTNGYHNGVYDVVVLSVPPGMPPARIDAIRAIVARYGPAGTRFIVRRGR